MRSTLVKEILAEKSNHHVWTVHPSEPLTEAMKTMSSLNIGTLIVTENQKICGIVSERDCVRRGFFHSKSIADLSVGDIMTTQVICVKSTDSLEQCMAVMTAKRIRHLPVVDDSRLEGIISIGDVVKAMLEEKQFMIEQLVTYITGSHQIDTEVELSMSHLVE